MGKKLSESKTKDKDGETKVLFKKSNATCSHSRTISGASQLYSRSGIMLIKKNLEIHHKYYTHKGKVKRDLSIETDICILRRYYRNKKNSLLGASSARYSTLVDTECETIEEYPDTSACGDNDNDTEQTSPPLDIASLMIDNLKDLLNQWIQKHLMHNKDTKQKIDTVLDSLIQKLDTRINMPSSSGSTYILHKEAGKHEVKNKKVATASLTCQYCQHKPRHINVRSSAADSNMSQKRSSEDTAPFQYKDIRIISTLSIPRSFHRRRLEEKYEQNSSLYRLKKMKHQNLSLSIDRSNKFTNSSSFDLVAISTKSLTKGFDYSDINARKKKRRIVFYPKPFFKSATDIPSRISNENIHSNIDNNDQLECMPSLLKSLYANEPIMPDKTVQFDMKNDNYTMTDNDSNEISICNAKSTSAITNDIYDKQNQEQRFREENRSNPIIAIDFTDQEIKKLKKSNLDIAKNSRIKIYNSNKKTSNRGKINKRRKHIPGKTLTFQSIHNKKFTFLTKKTNSPMSQGEKFLKHCQNIIHYFENDNKNKNIKFDVQINVYPTFECKKKDVFTDISYQTLGIYDIKLNPTVVYNLVPTKIDASVNMNEESIKHKTGHVSCSSKLSPEIIPLLDSSVCQAKYIFNVDSKEKLSAISKPIRCTERSTLTTELEIVQEISELRTVIKDLAAAAEKFVNEQLKRDSNKSNAGTNVSCNLSNYSSSSKVEAVISLRNPSKAIQYSREIIEKQKLLSGLKITKEPKKKEMFDFYNRLAKKSTSYRIIDSESILRVTDMTSRANGLNESQNNKDNQNNKEFKGFRDNKDIIDIRENRDSRVADETFPSSLQKSKSLFQVTSEEANKRKLIALFCDGGYQKNAQCRVCSVHRKHSSCSDKSGKQFKNLFGFLNKKKEVAGQPPGPKIPTCICRSDTNCTDSMPLFNMAPTNYVSSSTVTYLRPSDVERNVHEINEDEQSGTEHSLEDVRLQKCCKERKGMGFGEGCVYCVLLWIPVLLLACLFYAFVLKDGLKNLEARKVINRQGPEIRPRRNHSSVLYVKLSDLGF